MSLDLAIQIRSNIYTSPSLSSQSQSMYQIISKSHPIHPKINTLALSKSNTKKPPQKKEGIPLSKNHSRDTSCSSTIFPLAPFFSFLLSFLSSPKTMASESSSLCETGVGMPSTFLTFLPSVNIIRPPRAATIQARATKRPVDHEGRSYLSCVLDSIYESTKEVETAGGVDKERVRKHTD